MGRSTNPKITCSKNVCPKARQPYNQGIAVPTSTAESKNPAMQELTMTKSPSVSEGRAIQSPVTIIHYPRAKKDYRSAGSVGHLTRA